MLKSSSSHNLLTNVLSPPPTLCLRSLTVRTNAIFGGKDVDAPTDFYSISVKDINGKDYPMSKLKGKVVLFVNLASACGLTPQYADLAKLYDTYSSKGFLIVGQPCNQFGGQEPASNPEILKFASSKGAKFPILAKADVNGESATPLYKYLRSQSGGLLGSNIAW